MPRRFCGESLKEPVPVSGLVVDSASLSSRCAVIHTRTLSMVAAVGDRFSRKSKDEVWIVHHGASESRRIHARSG